MEYHQRLLELVEDAGMENVGGTAGSLKSGGIEGRLGYCFWCGLKPRGVNVVYLFGTLVGKPRV